MPPQHYEELEPHPELAPYILNHWAFLISREQAGPEPHHVPPDGCVTLAYGRQAGGWKWLTLMGPRLEAFRTAVHPGDFHVGARFWPGAAGAILGVSTPELRDRMLPLQQLFGQRALELMARLDECTLPAQAAQVFDEFLLPLARCAPEPDPEVTAAVCALVRSDGQLRISALAPEVGLSERQLLRRFRQATGLTPKELARLRRVRAAAYDIACAEQPSWGQVALEAGYFDQAHLAREFSQVLGTTPTTFQQRIKLIEHTGIRP